LKPAIIDQTTHRKGILFTFQTKDKQAEILFMTHAMERMTKWSLTPEIVGETLLDPEEVLVPYHQVFCHKKQESFHTI